MAEIRMNADMLRSKATELTNLKSTHDETMVQVRTLVNGLSEIWQGQAMTAFLSSFEGMQPTFTQFSERLQDLATKMNQAASELENADVSTAGKM